MVGELIMLPVRIGVRATRLWFRAAEETVSVATSTTGRLLGLGSRGSEAHAGAHPTEQRRSDGDGNGHNAFSSRESTVVDSDEIERQVSAALHPPGEDTPAPREQPRSDEAPIDPQPVHVSEEPSLVEEFAEPGAEEGAGAEVHIEPPWEGYTRMSAKQIVDRLLVASPAELAAVQLYESSHRNRQTVLNAAKRQLRDANGRSAGSQ